MSENYKSPCCCDRCMEIKAVCGQQGWFDLFFQCGKCGSIRVLDRNDLKELD